MKEYREPEAKFISLNPAEKVADTCWGYAVNGKDSPTYYFDLPGAGSLEFKIIEGYGGCNGGAATNISYVIDSNNDGNITSDERKEASPEQIKILIEAMNRKKVGPNTGDSAFHPGDLPSDWS